MVLQPEEQSLNYILLAFSVAITLTYGLIRNALSKNHVKNKSDYQVFNAVSSAISALVLIVIAFITKAALPSVYTLLLGVIFGILTALASIFNMRALEVGPLSYTTLICTSSMIIPALSGLVLFGESVGPLKYAGIALMLISVFLSVFQTDGGERKTSFLWLALSLLAMLFSGLIGVMQKIHQSSPHKDELLSFLIVAFIISAVYSIGAALYYDRAKKLRCTLNFTPRGPLVWMALVSGTFIALANQINLYLSGVMDSIVFFPVVNGAGLLLSIIASVVFLHERLTKSRWVGIVIGCAAVALLCV